LYFTSYRLRQIFSSRIPSNFSALTYQERCGSKKFAVGAKVEIGLCLKKEYGCEANCRVKLC
jgi:hypothetical protein